MSDKPLKLDVTREWCEKMAQAEEGQCIEAGSLAAMTDTPSPSRAGERLPQEGRKAIQEIQRRAEAGDTAASCVLTLCKELVDVCAALRTAEYARDEAQEARARLAEALRMHGEHKPGCASGWRAATGSSQIGPCDCGLADALSSSPAPSTETP